MKQEENIRELAIQYFEGRISRADEKNLFEYIEQVEGGYGRFRQWEREWMNHRNTDSETDAEWEALKHKMYTQEAIVPLLKKSKPGIWKIARIAAVIALIVGTTLGIQQAIYLFTPKTFFVCEAPLGDKSKIQLSDGTVVWLNAGSVLRYSNHFNTADRVVELEGEGYFEVTKQNGKQFTVKTHEYDVVVKGTKFNVSAYSDDSYITTTLLEGAVELNYKKDQIRMSPGQRLPWLLPINFC